MHAQIIKCMSNKESSIIVACRKMTLANSKTNMNECMNKCINKQIHKLNLKKINEINF